MVRHTYDGDDANVKTMAPRFCIEARFLLIRIKIKVLFLLLAHYNTEYVES